MFDPRFHTKKKAYKVYGNERTDLKLTKKAEDFTATCDPLEIREFTKDDGSHTYDVVGIIDSCNLTEDDLNELFEGMADEDAELEETTL